MEYLQTTPQIHCTEKKLHPNTAAGYWSTDAKPSAIKLVWIAEVRRRKSETQPSALRFTAYRDRKIKENPNGFLDRIDTIPTEKEHKF